jgi:hypothetical protein
MLHKRCFVKQVCGQTSPDGNTRKNINQRQADKSKVTMRYYIELLIRCRVWCLYSRLNEILRRIYAMKRRLISPLLAAVMLLSAMTGITGCSSGKGSAYISLSYSMARLPVI